MINKKISTVFLGICIFTSFILAVGFTSAAPNLAPPFWGPPTLFSNIYSFPPSVVNLQGVVDLPKPDKAVIYKEIIGTYIKKVSNRPADFAVKLAEIIYTESISADVDPLLITAIIKHESTYNPHCIGRAGERGLMQIHPCHRQFVRSQLFDPQYNVNSGIKVLKAHIKSAGSLRGGLRGYTGGRSGRYDRTYKYLQSLAASKGF